MEKMTTKDRILDSALTLFSERGYDGVGVSLFCGRVKKSGKKQTSTVCGGSHGADTYYGYGESSDP